MYPAIKAALPRAGIVANIGTTIRNAPSLSLGVGIISLYHFLGTSRTTCLLDQLFHKTPLGDILTLNIEDVILEAGLYGSLWDMPFAAIQQYVSSHSWLYAALK